MKLLIPERWLDIFGLPTNDLVVNAFSCFNDKPPDWV